MEAKNTLFSLELAVDSLCIVPHTVICRLPAVAFRLLDFPPLMIQQLDSLESKHLRTAVQNTWNDGKSIPAQLEELKSRHGNYEFNKGKSSLYSYEIGLLETHLSNTPLYVMIIDVWTEVPKLIGHCNISLEKVIGRIAQDVKEFGISVPSVHGTRGKFPVFNLMGSEIGWISLGIRLLSLGGNLMPHIPDAALTKKGGDHVIELPLDKAQLNLTQKRIPTHDAPVSVALGNEKMVDAAAGPYCGHKNEEKGGVRISVSTETDFATRDHQSTGVEKLPRHHIQNVKVRSRKQHPEVQMAQDHSIDDLYVTNIHVPPPLFFNSENELGEGQRFDHAQLPYAIPESINSRAGDDAGMINHFSSHFHEERKELEVQYTLHPPEFHSSPNVRKILRKPQRDKSPSSDQMDEKVHDKENRRQELNTRSKRDEVKALLSQIQVEHLRRLPVLNALLQELSLLTGSEVQPKGRLFDVDDQHHHIASRGEKQSDKENHLQDKHINRQAEVTEPMPEPPTQKVYRHKHKECAKPPSGVPPSKGWLRQQPLYGQRQSKKTTQLKFKMTNSQKLRLQRHNPEAFRLLEEEERIAEIRFQMRAAQMQGENSRRTAQKKSKRKSPAGPRPSENLVHLPDAVVATEISRHLDQEEYEDLRSQEEDEFKRGAETFKIPADDSPYMEQGEGEQIPAARHHHQLPHVAIAEDSENRDISGSEKSVRSISVRLPSTSVHIDDDRDDQASESSSDESQEEGPKVVSAPGFPSEEHPSEGPTPRPVPSSRGAYSDDFDGSYNFQSSGEQELASIESSNLSGKFSTGMSFDPNGSSRPVDSEHSGQSDESSYETADSVKLAGSAKVQGNEGAVVASPDPPKSSSGSSTSSKHPTAMLAIPQPQMSANSPVPLARRSVAKSVAFNQKSDFQPPKPKPRLSLDQTASSVSNASLLAPDLTLSNTRESTDVDTSDLRPGASDDYEPSDVYSDDFDSGEN